ncbi:MAG: tetratricopeptide repeat protein [Bryobacteraceae bacterium]|jgi:Tfp pilus assembly protein PilF
MRFVLVLLAAGCLRAATDPKTTVESPVREAIRLDPSRPDAHYRLGRLWHFLGREKDAEAEFAKVKELGKEQPQPPLIAVPEQNGELKP